jgi:hypothetical protein
LARVLLLVLIMLTTRCVVAEGGNMLFAADACICALAACKSQFM